MSPMSPSADSIPTAAASGFPRLDAFAAADAATTSGEQLRLIRAAAPRFRETFAATGKPDFVGTYDLVTLPYPTRYGLFRAGLSPLPFLAMTNRLIVVRWRDMVDGTRRTMLWEPSDVALGRNAPFYADLLRKTPPGFDRLAARLYGTVAAHVAALGIRPDEVDYLCFDHLHIQDVRRLLGTRGPAADLSPLAPVPALFPRARLIVQRRELAMLPDLHPLQRPWYQPATYDDLRPESLLVIEGDVLLGPGVALLATPGHTPGNHSLVLHTDTGIWASSENAVATECLTPEHSRIPGLRRWARSSGQELILNGNTIEATAAQYNSCIKEKLIVDRSRTDDRFLQFFPSAELTFTWLNPGAAPTFVHRRIAHGTVAAGAASAGRAA